MVFVKTEAEAVGHLYRAVSQLRIASKAMRNDCKALPKNQGWTNAMPISECYLFKNSFEFKPIARINDVPVGVRGIYVLFRERRNNKYDVVYIGMARGQRMGAR